MGTDLLIAKAMHSKKVKMCGFHLSHKMSANRFLIRQNNFFFLKAQHLTAQKAESSIRPYSLNVFFFSLIGDIGTLENKCLHLYK